MKFDFWGKGKKTIGSRQAELPEENDGYPDSHRQYGLCPRCNKQSSFVHLGALPATFDSSYRVLPDGVKDYQLLDRVSALNCRNCQQPTLVFEEKFTGNLPVRSHKNGGLESWRGFFWWPFLNVNTVKDVPEQVSSVLQEAKTCYSAQCYRASAVMSRRALEAIIDDKGIGEKTLFLSIKKLKESEIIEKNLYEWANEIRVIGNSGAHFDPIEKVEKKDADQIIMFIEELIKFIYVIPAQIEKRRNSKSSV